MGTTEVTMSYQDWVKLFGKPADDAAVKDAVKRAGVTKKIKIGNDELSVSADLPGTTLTIEFTDESVLDKSGKGIAGRPILSSVLITVQDPTEGVNYDGPLPHGLVKNTSRDSLRARFGTPAKSSEPPQRWDTWLVDGLTLFVGFTRDLQSINRVALSLPR